MLFLIRACGLVAALGVAAPALAQAVVADPGYCSQFYPNANCQTLGPGNPHTDGGYYRDQALKILGGRPKVSRLRAWMARWRSVSSLDSRADAMDDGGAGAISAVGALASMEGLAVPDVVR